MKLVSRDRVHLVEMPCRWRLRHRLVSSCGDLSDAGTQRTMGRALSALQFWRLSFETVFLLTHTFLWNVDSEMFFEGVEWS